MTLLNDSNIFLGVIYLVEGHMWNSGGNLKETGHSFPCVGPGDQAQFMRLGSKYLYPTCRFTSPECIFH